MSTPNKRPHRRSWGWASEIHLDLFPKWYAESECAYEGRHIRWADHQDLEHLGRGRYRYICHPYELDDAALADFSKLLALGWDVDIYGESEYHEHAMKVVIEKRGPRRA